MDTLVVNNVVIKIIPEQGEYVWFRATFEFFNLNTKEVDLVLCTDSVKYNLLLTYLGSSRIECLKNLTYERLPTLTYYLSLYGISEDTHELRRI